MINCTNTAKIDVLNLSALTTTFYLRKMFQYFQRVVFTVHITNGVDMQYILAATTLPSPKFKAQEWVENILKIALNFPTFPLPKVMKTNKPILEWVDKDAKKKTLNFKAQEEL